MKLKVSGNKKIYVLKGSHVQKKIFELNDPITTRIWNCKKSEILIISVWNIWLCTDMSWRWKSLNMA